MNDQPRLSEAEWSLITELLQRELDELPEEIHHTRAAQVRQELSERRDMIRDLLARVRPVAVV